MSVIEPSAISAVKNTVSDSVGCGWMVRPMSSASAPISRASTVSAISSPALMPTMSRAEDALRALLVEHLGEAFLAPHAERAAARRPREHRLVVLDALRLGLGLGQAHPGDFGIGVGHARDRARLPHVVAHARDHFGGELALVRRLVREHRLADDVADREDVRHVRAHLVVDGDPAALVHVHAGLLGGDRLAVRAPADREQHAVVDLGRRRRRRAIGALEGAPSGPRWSTRASRPWS